MLFSDFGWEPQVKRRQHDNYLDWLQAVEDDPNHKLVIVEIGAGKAIPTVREESEYQAAQLQATLIRINLRDYGIPFTMK